MGVWSWVCACCVVLCCNVLCCAVVLRCVVLRCVALCCVARRVYTYNVSVCVEFDPGLHLPIDRCKPLIS